MESEGLIRELRARGVVPEGAAGDTPAPSIDRPWYIGLMLGVAGWIAGIFILLFVALLFKPGGAGSAIVIGVVLLGIAWGLFTFDREGAFVSQLALALSVAGQFAMLFGMHELLFKHSSGFPGLALIALVLQLVLVVVMPSRLHRTMSGLFACIAWAILIRFSLWDKGGWTFSGGEPRAMPSPAAALWGWAIVWLPVGAVLYLAILREAEWMARGWAAIVRPACNGLIAGIAVGTLLSEPFESFTWMGSAPHKENWLVLWPLLAALASVGAMVAAFALGSRGLLATCVVAALLHMTHFYYAMGTTLLVKSVTLLVLGALLMGAAQYLKRPRVP